MPNVVNWSDTSMCASYRARPSALPSMLGGYARAVPHFCLVAVEEVNSPTGFAASLNHEEEPVAEEGAEAPKTAEWCS